MDSREYQFLITVRRFTYDFFKTIGESLHQTIIIRSKPYIISFLTSSYYALNTPKWVKITSIAHFIVSTKDGQC